MENNHAYLGAHSVKCFFNKPQLNPKFLTLDYSLFSKTTRRTFLQPRLQSNTHHQFNQKVRLSATQTVPPIRIILLHTGHFGSYLLIWPQKPPKRSPQGNYLESYSWIFRTRQYPKCNDPYLLQGQQINKPQHGIYTQSHSSGAVSHEETSSSPWAPPAAR